MVYPTNRGPPAAAARLSVHLRTGPLPAGVFPGRSGPGTLWASVRLPVVQFGGPGGRRAVDIPAEKP